MKKIPRKYSKKNTRDSIIFINKKKKKKAEHKNIDYLRTAAIEQRARETAIHPSIRPSVSSSRAQERACIVGIVKQREREKKKRPTKLTSNHHQGTSSPYLYIKETFKLGYKTIDCCVRPQRRVSLADELKGARWVCNNQRRTNVDRRQSRITSYDTSRY